MDRVGQLAAQNYGFDAPTSVLADLGQRDPEEVAVLGDYSRDKNAVRFNQNDVGLRDRMLETAVHEAMHAYERFLVDQFLGNRIPTQDPRYGLAQVLALSQPFYVQYTADRKRDHELQPSESYVWSLASQATASLGATRNQWHRSRH